MAIPLLERRLDEVDFCVIDLETTGFSPTRDEILEIGCVRVAPDGTVVDGLSSLVRPTGPVHGSRVHGIEEDDVAGAPRLHDLAGHVARCLDGALLVSWNVYFDYPFLKQQLFEPLGLDPEMPRLCCMYLRGLTGREPSRAKLADALAELALPAGSAHCAYDDALATARLLSAYVSSARTEVATFGQLAARGQYKFLASWSLPLAALPAGLPEGPARPRPSGFGQGAGGPVARPVSPSLHEGLSLARAVDRVWAAWPEARSEGQEAYLGCLCDALSDRRLTPAEMAQLADCARFYQLDGDDVVALHRRLVDAVVAEAASDGVVTAEEAHDLAELAGLLGVAAVDPSWSVEASATPSSATSRVDPPEEALARFEAIATRASSGRRAWAVLALVAVAVGVVGLLASLLR